MATMAAASVAVSSFSRATARGEANAKAFSRRRCRVAKATKVRAMSTRSGWEAGKAGMLALGASAVLMGSVGSAMAVEVLMGSDGGELIFSPNELSVAAGETVTFKNNAGFPHNVIFDEEEVPAGVDAASLSMNEEDLLNAPGETYSVKLDKKGTYRFYCSPHQGVGMYGTVTVN